MTETLDDRLDALSKLEGNDPEIQNLTELLKAAMAHLTSAQQTCVLRENPIDPHYRF